MSSGFHRTASPYLDNIAAVASRVVADCEKTHGTRISQLLASYVVRALAFQNPVQFDLSQPLSPADALDLVKVISPQHLFECRASTCVSFNPIVVVER